MAQIVINEISQNYTYNIGTNSYATVALPITSCWGPGFFNPDTYFSSDSEDGGHDHPDGNLIELMLDNTAWTRFPATQKGLESFVSTYRGPASNYRLADDYSYQIAMTLLTAGYDVLVCRICPGDSAACKIVPAHGDEESKFISLRAKYPGTFGNQLKVELIKRSYVVRENGEVTPRGYWNLITSVVDSNGIKTALENIVFTTSINNSTDSILYWKEVESNFVDIQSLGGIDDNISDDSDPVNTTYVGEFDSGTDYVLAGDSVTSDILTDAYNYADARYSHVSELGSVPSGYESLTQGYIQELSNLINSEDIDADEAAIMRYKEWVYTRFVGDQFIKDACNHDTAISNGVIDLLKDKLSYNPNRIISPGWDDQDICYLLDNRDELHPTEEFVISPIHVKLMDVAYYSRCATALIDIPRSLSRGGVYTLDACILDPRSLGYAQKLARFLPADEFLDVNSSLYQTHSALFAPWGSYQYVGTGKKNSASPSFQALMIQRAQILNQAAQYEWALPTNRKHKLRLGKLAYNVPKKLLDQWQTLEGVGVNVICNIPDLGTNLWGNSTLFEVPPATYQALANLSTRYLVNAVEDVAYRVGVSITFQYNNEQAYNKFYAGVTPTLDTMKNVGAIDDYYVKMAADINGLDQVNANTVIGKIYLVINGVINDIYIDLIALPPGTDLNQYRS